MACPPPSGEPLLHPRLRGVAASGWLPASLVAVLAAAVLHAYGTPIAAIAIFGGYVAIGIAVPGMLWVRLLRNRSEHLAEDLAMGLVFGYCLELAAYCVARWIGFPKLFVAWAVATLVLFAAVPRLRRCWRSGGERLAPAYSWSLALVAAYLVVYSAGTFFASHHLYGTDTPYIDMPYHLALIGELRNHFPPQVPYVADVPLAYHWFFYAETAATSWATGIEPATLLYRLSALPMFAAFIVLTAGAARRFAGKAWVGILAVVIALFATVAGPFAWAPNPVFDSQTLWATWVSPTNLFGVVMAAGITFAVLDALRDDAALPRRHWLLIAALFAGAAGAKASVLPVFVVGLVAAVLGPALFRRRFDRRAALALVLALLALGLAAALLYRGATDAVTLGLAAVSPWAIVSFTVGSQPDWAFSPVAQISAAAVGIALWSFAWAGAYGFFVRKASALADPRVMFLLGTCAGAAGVVLLMAYPAFNQAYYMRGAIGVFGIAAAAGLARVVPDRERSLPLLAAASVAALIGAAAVQSIAWLGPRRAPLVAFDGRTGVLEAMLLPIAALVAIVAATYVACRLLASRVPLVRGAAALMAMAVAMGFGLPNTATVLASPFNAPALSSITVPGDGIDAARWLRDHSSPDDVVATNLHCVWAETPASTCDERQFWVSAYTERRVLVEGWAYTQRASALDAPFWDPGLLATNDAAFKAPSPATLAALRDRYRVRWLFADLAAADAAGLDRSADLRFREGRFAVFELRPA